jgi:hypothetical protein
MTTLRQPAATAPAASSAVRSADAAADARTAPYRFAATQHLQRSEALLASLAADAGATPVGEISAWARDLMTDTRLLLTSPAVADPAMKKLLEDLELVLAQISAIPAARAREEVELIQDGINHSDMMLRLRAATAGPRLAGT